MDIKELLDEDAFDPEKLFNSEEYSTLIINREGFSKKENLSADLIEALLNKNITRPEAEELFKKLKESNAGEMLVNAIRHAEQTAEKSTLAAACWESGLDFSDHLLFFTELATSPDFQLAMEAITVIENCGAEIPQDVIKDAIRMAEDSKSENTTLTNDLLENLRSRLA